VALLPSFIAGRLFTCGLFLYPVNRSLVLTPAAASEASFLWRWDPHMSRYRCGLNTLAVGGKNFLGRYETSLAVKPVPHLSVSHLHQTRPLCDFCSITGKQQRQ